MVAINRCNIVYTHDGNSVAFGVGTTKAAAEKAAIIAAHNLADAEGAAWVKAEVANAVCPAACAGNPDYVVVRRGNAKTLAVFPIVFVGAKPIFFQAVAQQGWRAEYWCGQRRVESKEFKDGRSDGGKVEA